MQLVARLNPRKELHVVLDNSSTQAPQDQGLARQKPTHPLPLHADERLLVESSRGFFGILAKQSLRATDFPSKKALRAHLASYIAGWNQDPTQTRRGNHPKPPPNA